MRDIKAFLKANDIIAEELPNELIFRIGKYEINVAKVRGGYTIVKRDKVTGEFLSPVITRCSQLRITNIIDTILLRGWGK